MAATEEWTEPRSLEHFDAELAEVMSSSRTGVVLLLELVSSWPLQMRWLDRQVDLLAPEAIRRSSGEALLAVLLADAGLPRGWRLRNQLLERAQAHHVSVLAGLSSWPVQGSTSMDVLAAAAAALLDEQSSYRQSITEELKVDLDGRELALNVAGDFLTG